MKACVFCSHGLGDGLLFLILSNNLQKNGYEVETFHPHLKEMQDWFPSLKIGPFKKMEKEYDLIIINYDKRRVTQELIGYCKKRFPKKTWVLHLSTSICKKPLGDYVFNRNISVVENLVYFCKKELHLHHVERSNGIVKKKIIKDRKKIIIHPFGNKERYHWPLKKYISLAKKFRQDGFKVFFIGSREEKKRFFVKDIDFPHFSSLDEVASFIASSQYVIGNNSGIGHLASCLNIPTLILFSTRRQKQLWRPDWTKASFCLPSYLLPNVKFFRLKEKYWKNFISVSKIYKRFYKKYESGYFLCKRSW